MAISTQPHTEPFPGPRPFGREDQDRFFGRNREADRIIPLIIAQPVVMVYAAAWAGKTSLLNAHIIPRLERERCEVLPPVRIKIPFSVMSINSSVSVTARIPTTSPFRSEASMLITPEPPRPWRRYSSTGVRLP